MIADAVTPGDIIQHAAVSAVALAALAVVLRRVLGVFEKRSGSGGVAPPTPGCSHCGAGHAAPKKPAQRYFR